MADVLPLVSGLSVSPGIAVGDVRIISNPKEIDQVRYGDVLVVRDSNPRYAVVLGLAGGLICEVGGRLSHVCIVALEMGIPCITQAAGAMGVLKSVKRVRLDATAGVVHESI
jgi:pyruvate,water dikinase